MADTPAPAPAPRRRSYVDWPLADRLAAVDIATDAFAGNAEFSAALTADGLPATAVDDLRTGADAVREAIGHQTRATAAARAASDDQRDALAAAEDAHEAIAVRARAALRGNAELRRALGLDRKATRQAARLDQMQRVVDAPEHAPTLAPYGVTPDRLATLATALGAARTAVADADRLGVLAQDSTDHRDRLMADVDTRMADLQARARAAFADRPQFLELVALTPR